MGNVGRGRKSEVGEEEEGSKARNWERGAASKMSDEIDLDVDAYGFRVPHMQVGGVTI